MFPEAIMQRAKVSNGEYMILLGKTDHVNNGQRDTMETICQKIVFRVVKQLVSKDKYHLRNSYSHF
jgi:hypothetical protein